MTSIHFKLCGYCDVFIKCLDSFWRHPFTAEDPLVSKWYNVKFIHIYCDEAANSSTFNIIWRQVNFQQMFIFDIYKFNYLKFDQTISKTQ